MDILKRDFGDYVLLKKVATGGMAEVYPGLKRGILAFDKLVALKTILRHRLNDKNYLRLFETEARIGARFNHPNLIQVYDVCRLDNAPTLIMEYVPGPTVADLALRLEQSGEPISRKTAIRIVVDAALGLYHAHHIEDWDGSPLSIVHRDVSPQNILVGFNGRVKVFDFGIAQTANTDNGQDLSGMLAGKYAYMSPEQCRGEELDERSDVFSLGIILYELTVRRRLFRRKNQMSVLRAITEEEVTPPSKLAPDYPPELEKIVMAALARDPKDRPQTALELYIELERYAGLANELLTEEELGGMIVKLYAEDLAREHAFIKECFSELPPYSGPRTPANESETGEQLALEDLGAQTLESDALGADLPQLAVHDHFEPLGETREHRELRKTRRLNLTFGLLLLIATAGAGVLGLLYATKAAGPGQGAEGAVVAGPTVAIESEPPGAVVFLDGVERAQSTPTSIELQSGAEVELTLELLGYLPYQTTIRAGASGTETHVFVTMQVISPLPGQIRVFTEPEESELLLDGSPLETGLASGGVEIPVTGPTQVTATAGGYVGQAVDVVAPQPGEVAELWVLLPQEGETAELVIETNPSGALATLSGTELGSTPIEAFPLLAEQEFVLELVLDGYESVSEPIALAPGEMRAVSTRLHRIRRATREPEPEDDLGNGAGEREAGGETETEVDEGGDRFDLLLQ